MQLDSLVLATGLSAKNGGNDIVKDQYLAPILLRMVGNCSCRILGFRCFRGWSNLGFNERLTSHHTDMQSLKLFLGKEFKFKGYTSESGDGVGRDLIN